MNTFFRIFTTVRHQLDNVVSDFENHEALADVALNDLQQLQGQTRLQLHRIRKLIQQHEENIKKQKQQADTWTKRALSLKDNDETAALECMKRLRHCKQSIQSLQKNLDTTRDQESKMQNNLQSIQEQLHQLSSKKHELIARQQQTKIFHQTRSPSQSTQSSANQIINRWEETLISQEDETFDSVDFDPFNKQFEEEEDMLELKSMLDELSVKTAESE